MGEVLLNKRHGSSVEIQQRVNNLIVKWNELLQASNERGKGLEEARDILKFNEEVEKVEEWFREKVCVHTSTDFSIFLNLFLQILKRYGKFKL